MYSCIFTVFVDSQVAAIVEQLLSAPTYNKRARPDKGIWLTLVLHPLCMRPYLFKIV